MTTSKTLPQFVIQVKWTENNYYEDLVICYSAPLAKDILHALHNQDIYFGSEAEDYKLVQRETVTQDLTQPSCPPMSSP